MVADTVEEALAKADLVVSCLPDYDSTTAVLDTPRGRAHLRGATLVQLASGTPDQARAMAEWCAQHDIDYLDGKIFTYPVRIGRPETVIGYSGGSRWLFERVAPTLQLLAGSSRYLGARPEAAAVVDTAWLATFYGATVGILQGAAFCSAHNIDLSALLGLVPAWLNEINGDLDGYDAMLAANDFTGDG